MCHFFTCSEVLGIRNQCISQKLWAHYLFQDVDHPKVAMTKLDQLNQVTIEARIANLGETSYVSKSNEDGFKAGAKFHYQAQTPIFL